MPRASDDTDHGGTSRRRLAWPILVAVLMLCAFLISLLASLPARVAARYAAPPVQVERYSGTVWNGTASLAGGNLIAWRIEPWSSLVTLRPRLSVTLAGPGTDLAASVALPGLARKGVRVEKLDGRVAWPLVAALAPTTPVVCDMGLAVQGVTFDSSERAADGLLRSGPGSCVAEDGTTVTVPPLSGRLSSAEGAIRLEVSRADASGSALGDIVLRGDDTVALTVSPAGAALIPGLPSSAGGDIVLEYPLSALGF